MDGTPQYYIQNIARKLAIVRGYVEKDPTPLSKNPPSLRMLDLIDEILDTDIPELQAWVKENNEKSGT